MRRDAVGMIGAIGRGSAGAVGGERGIGGVWERAGMGAAVEVMWKAYGRGGEEGGDLPVGGRSGTSDVTMGRGRGRTGIPSNFWRRVADGMAGGDGGMGLVKNTEFRE